MKGKHAKEYKAGGTSPKGSYIGKTKNACGARPNCPKKGGNSFEGKKA